MWSDEDGGFGILKHDPVCCSCRSVFTHFSKDPTFVVSGVVGTSKHCPSRGQYYCQYCRIVHSTRVDAPGTEDALLAGVGRGADGRDGTLGVDRRLVAYVVAVIATGRKKFRRLHKGSLHCGRVLGVRILNRGTHQEDKRIRYGDFCHKCWPAGELPGRDLSE